MRIGVPTEIKNEEHRVAVTPAGVRALTDAGHEVLIQAGAGEGSQLGDEQYTTAGARIVPDAEAVWGEADLVTKVKEPQAQEIALMRPGQTLFAYLHLAPDPEQTRGLLDSGATAIAFETVTDAHGRLPLLAPMSQVAGRMATQVGATLLERPHGGLGVLMGGVPGVAGASVMILGGGVAGTQAATVAIGMGARVTVLDTDLERLAQLDAQFGPAIVTRASNALTVEELLPTADLVIGTVLVPGARTPHLISREQLSLLREGTVVVDVAVDQGGSLETSRPTTHDEPTYVVDGVLHYAVANMPGAVPVTSTQVLTNATLPYLMRLAEQGESAWREDPHLAAGVNVVGGELTIEPVARALDLPYTPLDEAGR